MKHLFQPSSPSCSSPLAPVRGVRGFALFEVMVTVLLLSAGFLAGALALARTAREERSALFMGRAAGLAADMADRIRNNKANWMDTTLDRTYFQRSDSYANLLTVPSGTPQCKGQSTGQMGLPEPPTAGGVCQTPTAAQVAQYDIYSWAYLVQRSLPAGVGMVLPAAGVPGRTWVVVAWSEPQIERNANKTLASTASYNLNCPTSVLTTLSASSTAPIRCYLMEVQP